MLLRFDPFRELDRVVQSPWAWGRNRPALPMDAYRQGDRFVVHFDLPGIDPASIDLTVEKNVLTLSAERAQALGQEGQEAEAKDILVAERPYGTFSRQLFLGEALDADRIQAHYEHGVLTLTIPVAEQAKPRKVEVTAGAEAGSGARAITTGASEAA
jgi:HSP20 family protein